MKNVSAHSAKSPAIWLVNPFTDWKANLVSAIQNGTRALFVCAALIVVLAFALPLAAQAQNNSANPYINSTHRYRVKMGDMDNSAGVSWQLRDPSNNVVVLGAWGTPGLIDKAGSDQDSAYVDIKFENNPFGTTPGLWTLIYSEESVLTGACIARRSVTFTPTTNDFKLSLAADDDDCNSFAGHVWNNTDDLTADADGTIDFKINMEKNSVHLVRSWTFEGTVTFSTSDYQVGSTLISTTTGTTAHGSWAITAQSGSTFTLVFTVSNPTTDSYSSDAVPITININGPPITDVGVTLTISNAVARSGTHYTVVTDDTGSADEHIQTRTLWGIPNTSVISVSAN